jgi:AraC-like DNA-binding protein
LQIRDNLLILIKRLTSMSVFAPALTFIWQTIESYGLDPAPLFRAEGVRVSLPVDPRLRIRKEVLDRVRARAVERLGVQTFGLRAAQFIHPSNFGALGYAWMASSTLRSAFGRLSKYITLFNIDAEVRLRDSGGYLVVTDILHSPSENYAARDDTSLAILVQLCRFICGQKFSPARVSIRHAEPADPQPWKDFFGCEVSFGAAHNRIWIEREQADRNLPSANAQLALINDQLLARDFARLETSDTAARVRAMITEHLSSGGVSENSVARELRMTPRTMHRRLAGQGTNFRNLLAQVRRELAERYLGGTSMPLTEIAFLLGFSQVSSFSRAYKRWTGTSPSEARRNHAG